MGIDMAWKFLRYSCEQKFDCEIGGFRGGGGQLREGSSHQHCQYTLLIKELTMINIYIDIINNQLIIINLKMYVMN